MFCWFGFLWNKTNCIKFNPPLFFANKLPTLPGQPCDVSSAVSGSSWTMMCSSGLEVYGGSKEQPEELAGWKNWTSNIISPCVEKCPKNWLVCQARGGRLAKTSHVTLWKKRGTKMLTWRCLWCSYHPLQGNVSSTIVCKSCPWIGGWWEDVLCKRHVTWFWVIQISFARIFLQLKNI